MPNLRFFSAPARWVRWPATTTTTTTTAAMLVRRLCGHVLATVAWVCLCGPVWAALDVNQASEADLDSLRGVGPAMTARILAQRAQAPFTDWADLMHRVKGLRIATARRLAEQGLSVNGQALPPAEAVPAQAR